MPVEPAEARKASSRNSLLRPVLWLNSLSLSDWSVRVWGRRMTAPSMDRYLCLLLHRVGCMGRSEKALFEAQVRPGMTVIDVGANQGLYTLLLSRLVGESGRVIAFEPEPDMYSALQQNCRGNSASNVELHNTALGSAPGTAVLSRSMLNAGDNRLAPGDAGVCRQVQVPVSTMDDMLQGKRIDLIKIDVQGWEWEVFQGMDLVFGNNPDLAILFEYWPRGLRNAGCDPPRLLAFLESRGFQLCESDGAARPVADLSRFDEHLTGNRFTNIWARRGRWLSS